MSTKQETTQLEDADAMYAPSVMSRRAALKIGAGAGAFLGIAGLSACSGGTKNAAQGTDKAGTKPAKTHTVTDMKGVKVEVPVDITSIADLWHGHNPVTLMLGGAPKLVATTDVIKTVDWYVKVNPSIKNVKSLLAGSGKSAVLNTEELIKLKPSVVIAASDSTIKAARENGIPAVNCMFQNYEGMRKSVALTAEVFGGQAPEIAKKWAAALDKNLNLVTSKTSKLKESEKPKVLHIVNLAQLTVDGKTSIVNEWIEQTGGINAIQEGTNLMQVTLETIVKSDPDVIIIGGDGSIKSVETILADPKWSGIKAVKAKAVYPNPVGTYLWDRYPSEAVLQLLWSAQKLHPELFKDINLVMEVQNFYKDFYNYKLTDDQAKRIINAQKPE